MEGVGECGRRVELQGWREWGSVDVGWSSRDGGSGGVWTKGGALRMEGVGECGRRAEF